MSQLTKQVSDAVEPLITKRKDELVDLEYVKERGKNYLRLYVDKKPKGIDLNEISALSDLVSKYLDQLKPDPFPGPYILEISSPGVERPIKSKRDWQKARDHYIYVSLYQKVENHKTYTGFLRAYDNQQIELEIRQKTRKKTLTIPRKLIAKIRFAIKF